MKTKGNKITQKKSGILSGTSSRGTHGGHRENTDKRVVWGWQVNKTEEPNDYTGAHATSTWGAGRTWRGAQQMAVPGLEQGGILNNKSHKAIKNSLRNKPTSCQASYVKKNIIRNRG